MIAPERFAHGALAMTTPGDNTSMVALKEVEQRA
jgi:hypothetical protein